MRSASRQSLLLLSVLFCLTGPSAVQGDWDPGDGHKMHFPQLPDPNGWDVRISNARRQPGEPPQWIIADDWQCSASGPVSDVHFWVSWRGDLVDLIDNVHLSVHSNNPQGPDGWSIPEQELWAGDFGAGQFTVRDYGLGDQGWYDPVFQEYVPNDHQAFYQINVMGIRDPFIQRQGEIYWLDISVDLRGESETGQLGWKTSPDHFMDDAVYWDPIDQRRIEIFDPSGQSLDMAFVVNVPEPATLGLWGLGLLGLLWVGRRQRRRH